MIICHPHGQIISNDECEARSLNNECAGCGKEERCDTLTTERR